jgi:hypothetical protein
LKKPSILHIAPENTAGVPYNLNDMQNRFGFLSRLITFYKVPFDYNEDICLNLPLPKGKIAMSWRKFKQKKLRENLDKKNKDYFTNLPYFKPKNIFEKLFMYSRQLSNEKEFVDAINSIDAGNFDIIQFDGGIDFYMNSKFALEMKSKGKRIVNCYYGDDLRTRGIIKKMDEISDLNLTFEYDHTLRHPDINFLFFPFDNSNIEFVPDKKYNSDGAIRIVHAPTNRKIKGTPAIIKAIEEVKKSRNIEFILLEDMPRDKVIDIKKTCHIAIDQVGNRGGTGYGINSLETLSMGIPTITDMNCGMDEWLTENPFLVANENNLKEKLSELIENEILRLTLRNNSRKWVEKYHSYQSVFKKLIEIYSKNEIINKDLFNYLQTKIINNLLA